MPALTRSILAAFGLFCATCALRAEDAEQILEATGLTGGLVVHLGCGDGRLTAALCADERYLVHGIDTDPEQVETARKHITSLDLYGRVSADLFDGTHLPYVDNLVNLVVVSGDEGRVSKEELMRVLAPGGVALVAEVRGQRSEVSRGAEVNVDGRKWAKLVRRWPKEIDEWTHFLHDASGNAVAKDDRVGSPRRIQWMAGPKRCRDHDALASMSAMTSSAGRLFYIFDEGHTSLVHRPPKWRLVARDAFNGVLLWKREIPTWVTHLWYFRTGPAQLPRRLVSVGDRVYVTLGFDAPVVALDAATGKTQCTFDGSEKTEEIIHHRNTVLTVIGDPEAMNDEAPQVYGYWELSVERKPTFGKAVAAYRADTGKLLWRKTGENLASLAPLSLSALGDRVFFLDNEHLHCVRLDDGGEVWKAPFPTEGLFLRNYAPTVVAYDDVVMCMTWDRLHAFSIADGKKLWEQKGAIGFASPGDLFAIKGLAWVIPHTAAIWKGNRLDKDGKIKTGIAIPRDRFIGNKAAEIWGVDIHTGEVRKSLPRTKLLPGGHHARCYRNKATERYLICGRRGLEYLDLVGDNHVNNWWVRGLCQYGVMPANGYTYVPPDPCQCFSRIKINGFYALSSGNSLDTLPPSTHAAIERGPAYAQAEPAARHSRQSAITNRKSLAWQPPIYPPQPEEWPTFRGNITRSGSTQSRVPASLAKLWQVRIGGSLTPAVAADEKLFVCSKDAHTVHCLDAKTGKHRWQFAAGGRVDSPPTICGGLCVFGCRGGAVYCLRASDGVLAWRFRAAPVDRRVVADSRLESVWPIHGSVLVQDGVVYFAAGRSSFLDGGIRLFGLELHSGRKLHEMTHSTSPGTLGGKRPPPGGALPDVLVSDGSAIGMRSLQFNRELKPGARSQFGTLFASTGLLEDTWAHRQPWRLGRARGSRVLSKSKLIVFDGDRAYGVMNPYTWLKGTRALWPEAHDGHLHQKYSRYQPDQFPIGTRIAAATNGAPPGTSRNQRRGKGKKPTPKRAIEVWAVQQPLQPRAMVLTGDMLFLAGWRDAVAIRPKTGRALDPQNPDPRPAVLQALSTANGKTLAEHQLDCEPVFDGLIAAYGKLFLSMRDGSLSCYGEK